MVTSFMFSSTTLLTTKASCPSAGEAQGVRRHMKEKGQDRFMMMVRHGMVNVTISVWHIRQAQGGGSEVATRGWHRQWGGGAAIG